jgi:branched-chain amino acid transport system permease protein
VFPLDHDGHVSYVYCLIVLFALFVLARTIINSPFGLSLSVVRNNPKRASLDGMSVNGRLSAIYTVAAFYAGVAGGLQAQTMGFISPDTFSIYRSFEPLFALALAGMGYLYGGLIGAIILVLIQFLLSKPAFWQLLFGIGLLGLASGGLRWLQQMTGGIRLRFGDNQDHRP